MRRFYSMSISAVLLFTAPVMAQQASWSNYENAGKNAYESGKFIEAEKIFELALQAAQNAGPGENKDVFLARTYNDLGAVSRDLGHYTKSEELITKAIPLISKTNGDESPLMGYALLNLANIYATMAKPNEAEQLYIKVVNIAERRAKKLKNNSIAALPLTNLGNAYIEDGKYKEAAATYARAMAVYDNPKVKKDLYYAGTLFGLSSLYLALGDYKKADEYSKICLQFAEGLVGKDNPYYGKALINRARICEKTGRYQEAEELLAQAKAQTIKNLGENHPEIPIILNLLAKSYDDQGDYAKAEPIIANSLEHARKAFGSDHPFVVEALIIQGNIYHDQGKYKEAEADYREGIEATERTMGSDHPWVARGLTKLGELYLDDNRTTEAEAILKRALTIDRSKLSSENSDVADIERLLAATDKAQGKDAEAEALYKHSIQATEASLGKAHYQYGAAVRELGKLYQKQGKYPDAEALYRQSLATDEKVFGESSPKVASDLDLLTKLYIVAKEPAKAAETTKRADGIKQTLPGTTQLSVLKTSISDNEQKLKQPAKPVSDKWALVVGISNFADPSINLKFAAKDATDFKNFLVTKEQFAPDHVRLLTDKNATKENIIAQLGDKWLGRVANKDDLVLLYMSTHGSGSQQEAGGVNFLVAENTDKNKLLTTGIPMQWLTSIIKEQIHSNRVVIIMDVCHSAAAAPAAGSKELTRGDEHVSKNASGVDAEKIPLGEGQSILCSSLADQVSWESKIYPNSVFTKKLMEALQTKGTQTTLTDAYAYLKDAVESEVLRDRAALQTPILNTKLWTGGDAAVAVKPSKPRKGL
jgi:tetratricopeptide (TPR) repeat protein